MRDLVIYVKREVIAEYNFVKGPPPIPIVCHLFYMIYKFFGCSPEN